jgi:excisionase family DNA binding protein
LTASTTPDRLAYSPAELARLLGCTRQHVQNMIARGELPSVKFGRKRLIPAAVVAQQLDTEARGPGDARTP